MLGDQVVGTWLIESDISIGMDYYALYFTKATLKDNKAKLQQKEHRGDGLSRNLSYLV